MVVSGIDPAYFLDSMTPFEVRAYLKAKENKDRQDLETQRFFFANLLAPYAKKGVPLNKIIPLPTDQTEPTEADFERLKKAIEEKNKEHGRSSK